MADLKLIEIPHRYPGKHRVVGVLEDLLEMAKQGKITGIVFVTEEEGCFGWGKCNVTYPQVLGMLTRAQYHVNREWDAAKAADPEPPKAS